MDANNLYYNRKWEVLLLVSCMRQLNVFLSLIIFKKNSNTLNEQIIFGYILGVKPIINFFKVFY
jgi:hypothetical protein